MAKLRIKLYMPAIVHLGLRSQGVRNRIYEEGERRARALGSAVGIDKVRSYRGGRSRARYTLRRLESMREETKDGILSRVLRGGGQ